MKIVYKDLVFLLSAWLMGWACSHPQNTQSQADAKFRDDPQHTGVYATKAVQQFKEIKWAHKNQRGGAFFTGGDERRGLFWQR